MTGANRGKIPSELGFLIDILDNYGERLSTLEAPDGNQIAQTVKKLTEIVAAIPVTLATTARQGGFALSSGWATYATAALTVPAGKSIVTILGIGAASALDKTSGGATSARARILIAGVASGEFPASKDAGASVVANVLNAQSSRAFAAPAGSTIVVEFQISPLNPAAFTADGQNFAQITALGSFT